MADDYKPMTDAERKKLEATFKKLEKRLDKFEKFTEKNKPKPAPKQPPKKKPLKVIQKESRRGLGVNSAKQMKKLEDEGY